MLNRRGLLGFLAALPFFGRAKARAGDLPESWVGVPGGFACTFTIPYDPIPGAATPGRISAVGAGGGCAGASENLTWGAPHLAAPGWIEPLNNAQAGLQREIAHGLSAQDSKSRRGTFPA